MSTADCTLMSVTFGGVDCPINSCDATQLECAMPPLSVGTWDVVVTDPDNGSAASDPVTVDFRIDDFSPTTSGLTGGAPLYVHGEGMSIADATITVCCGDCAVDLTRSTATKLVAATLTGNLKQFSRIWTDPSPAPAFQTRKLFPSPTCTK